jgi:dimethylaniline monooxygenase (N-oxide forming)
MNVGKRSTSWANRVRSAYINVEIKDTEGKKIDVVSWPEKIDSDGLMSFGKTLPSDSVIPTEQRKPDVLIFATGFTRDFPFLDKEYPSVSQTNVRGIYKEGDVTIGYIGFIRPAIGKPPEYCHEVPRLKCIGAIPPLAELQAQLWVLRLLQDRYPREVPSTRDSDALEPYELDYQLHARGNYSFWDTKRGVDHESYAYQLALDMGSAPRAWTVMKKGFKVFYTWAMGSNFNTKFRFVGPWKWNDGAESIMRNELFNVVKRSGGFVCE